MNKVVRLIHNDLVKRNARARTHKAAVTVLAKTQIEDSEIKNK